MKRNVIKPWIIHPFLNLDIDDYVDIKLRYNIFNIIIQL